MQYKIFGTPLPAVSIALDSGESIYTQSSGMSWMTSDIRMETNMKGGFLKGLGRTFSGESLFMVTYTAQRDAQELTISSGFPGEIRAIELAPGREYIAQKSSFLCATNGVQVNAFVVSAKAGLFGGEGFILQRYTGSGIAFLELDGTIVEKELAAGEVLKVDPGKVAAFEGTVTYSAEMLKGFSNILFGGNDMFLATLKGPGKVWLQTMSAASLARKIIPFIPTATSSN